MKRDQKISCLIAAGLSFCISFSGIACIITGFKLDFVSLFPLAMFCAVFSAAVACSMLFRRGPLVLAGVCAVILGFLWRTGVLEPAVEALLYHLSSRYDCGYGWGVVRWLPNGDPSRFPPELGFCLIAGLTALAVSWTVCRRKPAIWAVFLSFVPLIACLVVTDTVPDTWCLFLLLGAIVLLMLTHTVRRRSVRDGNRLTAILLIPAILATSLLFWAVPRKGYAAGAERMQQQLLSVIQNLPFVEMGSDGKLQFGTGGTTADAVDLTNIGPKSRFTYAVMNVTSSQGGLLYLRGQALDYYDGESWTASDIASGEDHGWPEYGLTEVGTVEITTLSGHSVLYFPYYPGGENWVNDFTQGRIDNPGRIRNYTFTQMQQSADSTVTLSYGKQNRYLSLPSSVSSRAQAHLDALGLNLNGTSASQIAEAIKRYVRNSAEYSLNTQRMPETEDDFAMWFLESSDTGYCVHFATAAAVLLRAAGIPSRYVTGYMVTVTAGKETTVTADQSHAWVEYFDPQRGWQLLDATPSDDEDPVETTTSPSVTTEPSESTEPSVSQGTKPTLPSEETTEPSEDVTQPSGENKGGSGKKKLDLGWLWTGLKVLGWIVGCCVLIIGQYLLRLRYRRKQMLTGPSNQRALARWREALRYSKLLKKEPPEALLALAEKAKFSQHTLTAAERMEFDRYINECSGELAAKPLIPRTLARLIWAVA